MTIDSEVSGIMRANIDGKVNLNVLSGDVREESQAQSEEQEEKRKKKAGKAENFKKCVIFKKKSPANTLFTGLFLVPVAGVEPARVLAQRILSPPRLPIPTHRQNTALLGYTIFPEKSRQLAKKIYGVRVPAGRGEFLQSAYVPLRL